MHSDSHNAHLLDCNDQETGNQNQIYNTEQQSAYRQTSKQKTKKTNQTFSLCASTLSQENRQNYLEDGSRQSHSGAFCLLQAQFCLTGSIRSEHTRCPTGYTQQLLLHDGICFIIITQPEQDPRLHIQNYELELNGYRVL